MQEKVKILFVCHGNICRSPMAEYIMKNYIQKYHLENKIYVESAATSSEEIYRSKGNPVYPPARDELLKHGIDPTGKYARRITKEDYHQFDYLIGMDHENIRNLHYLFPQDKDKIRMLNDTPVNDPWYTGDFTTTYTQINQGCMNLLNTLIGEDIWKK